MPLARQLWVLALLAGWPGIGQAAPEEPSRAAPETIATRQTSFSIPFQIDRAAAAVNPPVEVHLHVSADRGVRWDIYDKVKPDRGGFVFRAPRDGEYWFCIRSIDKAGKSLPGGPLTPGLKVLVDTLAPRLEVTAERLSTGELSAQWQVVDPDLNPDSLKAEYRTDEAAPWEPLAANQIRNTGGRSTVVGEGTWWLQDVKGPVTIRIQIADRAGNPAVTQVVVKPPTTDIARTAEAPAQLGPSLGAPAPVNENRVAENDPNRVSVSRRDSRMLPVSNTAETDTSVGKNPFDKYRDRASEVDVANNSNNSNSTPPGPLPPSRNWPAQGSATSPLKSSDQGDWRVSDRSGNRPGFVHTGSNDAGKNTTRPTGNAMDGRTSLASTGGGRFDYGDLAPSERPKMVNSRTFQVDYEIESVGAAGVSKVELFGTRDGGQTWVSLGTDPDNRSPLVVTVNGEGLYGFQVIVQSASGLGGAPPRAGQRPELWIGVDLTKPQATLTGAEPGNNPDELVIYWDARDRRLEGRPISLSFSDKAHGPWLPIAAGLENTGNYTWRMDSRVKEQVYLKLEVRDEAGNITAVEAPEAVSLNRQLPQGRIRGVRPVTPENSGDQARKPVAPSVIENQFAR